MTEARIITFNGHSRTIAEWAAHLGIKTSTLRNRLRSGWTIEDALTGRRRDRSTETDREPEPIDKDGDGAEERALWLAVIKQAITDATANTFPGVAAGTVKAATIPQEARDWLLGDSEDLHAVCGFAGVSTRDVRQAALLAIAGDATSDAGPGVGQDLPDVPGTGGGRFARHAAQTEFPAFE